ncbi:hypothetical protein G3H63_05075 [Microbacterium resistens]|uniref:DUF6264 family protein n=1 Tax=Microbacterium resistens TaxID=156977 RepID=A0ABY3RSA0_9MICO|nr:DUF6264 family protein [Microbacterium resistens]MBW1638454.1 hypothetical protein [Microbacterium resistens]UGS26849.1 DUF6264 family protein [Microbacterium resistens]
MSDPRPQYGEYATPEEQRRRAGLPEEVTPPAAATAAPAAAAPATAAPAPTDSAAARTPRPADRLITIALLAYGLVNVIMSVISYSDVSRLMSESMRILGIDGEFTNYEQGRLWATIASIVLIVGWTATAAWAVTRLRRGRTSWWVPLVGAVVSTVLASICLSVALLGDPAFLAYLGGASTR